MKVEQQGCGALEYNNWSLKFKGLRNELVWELLKYDVPKTIK